MPPFKADVIVLAGTYDARQIIRELVALNLRVAATVTTQYGHDLIEKHPNVTVFARRLTVHGMCHMIRKYAAKCIVDATHPYAVEASENAMKASQRQEIKYLRYERAQTPIAHKNVVLTKDFLEAAKLASKEDGNILLTIGSKNLEVFFKNVRDFQKRLFVRILPDAKTMEQCEKAGLSRGNIIALRGPFSESFNIELYKHVHAKTIVTKDSGAIGGSFEKINAALSLNMRVILIDRPDIVYDEMVGSISEVIFWIGNPMGKKG